MLCSAATLDPLGEGHAAEGRFGAPSDGSDDCCRDPCMKMRAVLVKIGNTLLRLGILAAFVTPYVYCYVYFDDDCGMLTLFAGILLAAAYMGGLVLADAVVGKWKQEWKAYKRKQIR